MLREWAKVNPDAVAREWGSLLPRVTDYVQRGQIRAAEGTHTFMRELLGPEAVNAPQVVPEQFASQTPDGRDLMGLLARAIPTTIRARLRGKSAAEAHAHGGAFLDMVTRTVVSDTGRQADQAAMVANRKVVAYIRVVELPACSRCIILSSREYGVSAGFLRHPRCDCTMEPVTRRHTPTTSSPNDLFEQMTPAQRKRAFGEDGMKAIEDGARISSVVNARKAMDTVEMFGRQVQVTHVGTGSRRKPRRPPRLMPEEIYKQAGDDRTQAIRLLYRNGYLR